MFNTDRIADWHHPQHPRRALLGMGVEGAALRASRVQWVMYGDHHDHYHERFGYHAYYEGPRLPEPGLAWFRAVVFASADYVPAKGIDFRRNGEPHVRTMRTGERLQLLNSGMIRVDRYDDVKQYLLSYLGEQGLFAMNEPMVDEFLYNKDAARKQALGEQLIRLASEVAADPLRDLYREAKKEEFLPHQRSRSVANFICNLLTYKTEPGHEPDIDTIMAIEAYLPAA